MAVFLAPLLAAMALGSPPNRPPSWGSSGPRSIGARRHWLLQQHPMGAQPQPQPPRQEQRVINRSMVATGPTARGVFNVLDYGAKANNQTDDTAAFASALAAAHAAKGGEVYAPPGLYVLAGNLTIPPGVSLTGSYRVVPSHDVRNHQPIDDGTVLIPTGSRGSIGCAAKTPSSDPEDGPATPDLDCTRAFITVTENALVQGLVVYYREQERVRTPVPYPWTFFLGNPDRSYGSGASADNAAVVDVEVLGCWNCIAAVQAHRHYIARVQGQPLNIGVFVDATYDIGRMEDIHFNPWFSSESGLIKWQVTYGRAFVFGRSDWEYVFNTFAFAYAIGYHFIERATGSMNGNFLGIGMDAATNSSVQVDQSQPYGILITNGE
eukprot:COSAG01_NODE_7624_length_3123_cov_2.814815_2_plen_379_part_00